MGLFGLFGSRTKADIDREIASLQGEIARIQATGLQKKDINARSHIASYKAKIASLRAERKRAK